jgi:hypothetical protein
MNFALDPEAVKAAVTKSILDLLTPDKREALITAAIASLFEMEDVQRPRGSWGGTETVKRTKLQGMFEKVVTGIAHEVVYDVVTKNELLRTKLREMTTQTIDAFCKANQEKLATKFSDAVAKAMLSRDE